MVEINESNLQFSRYIIVIFGKKVDFIVTVCDLAVQGHLRSMIYLRSMIFIPIESA